MFPRLGRWNRPRRCTARHVADRAISSAANAVVKMWWFREGLTVLVENIRGTLFADPPVVGVGVPPSGARQPVGRSRERAWKNGRRMRRC